MRFALSFIIRCRFVVTLHDFFEAENQSNYQSASCVFVHGIDMPVRCAVPVLDRSQGLGLISDVAPVRFLDQFSAEFYRSKHQSASRVVVAARLPVRCAVYFIVQSWFVVALP